MSMEEQENERIEMEREEEKLKGVKRRIEIEKRKREAKQKDIMEARVKVSYSMPLWLREKINDESLKLGLYQWEYIAKMIEKAEKCSEGGDEQLRMENEEIKAENERLKVENEGLKAENKRLKEENETLRRKAGRWRVFIDKVGLIIDALEKSGAVVFGEIEKSKGKYKEYEWDIEFLEGLKEKVESALAFLEYLREELGEVKGE
jgi:FtsZ-binding cell division protein ZapB